jgi:putative hydrolase of the HAD superfamily
VGTLIFPDPPAHLVYAEVARQFGSRLDPETIRRRFGYAFAEEEQRDLAGDLRTSEERERRRWAHIVSVVFDDVTDALTCFDTLYQHFARPSAWRCAPQTQQALATLAQRHPLALASNYDQRLHSVFAGLPELHNISHLIISSEVGWRKPAREFFAAISQALALPPEEVLYVGDDLINDYRGGEAAGLQVVLLDPAQREMAGVECISELAELVIGMQ